jgi:hypothetical protein
MSISQYKVGDDIFSVMKNPATKSAKGEKWLAVCPSKGDAKWFAPTEAALLNLLKSGAPDTPVEKYKAPRTVIWESEGRFEGKSVVTIDSLGVVDVNTPTVRYRMEVEANFYNGGSGPISSWPRGEPTLEEASYSDLPEEIESFDVKITKLRFKNSKGETVEDVDVTYVDEGNEDAGIVRAIDNLAGEQFAEDGLLSDIMDGNDICIDFLKFPTKEINAFGRMLKIHDSIAFLKQEYYQEDTENHSENLQTTNARCVLAALAEYTRAIKAAIDD